MRVRRLGRTGLRVSELAFGGGRVGGILIHGSETARRAVLARALEAGFDLIDTAPSYGDGVSEATLGRLLPELGASPSSRPRSGSTRARPTLRRRWSAASPAVCDGCGGTRSISCNCTTPSPPPTIRDVSRRTGRSTKPPTRSTGRASAVSPGSSGHRPGRDRRGAPGYRERAFRHRSGLLQPAQPECGRDDAGRLGRARFRRRDGGLPRRRHGRREHPRPRRRRHRQRAPARARGSRYRRRRPGAGEASRGGGLRQARRGLRRPRANGDPVLAGDPDIASAVVGMAEADHLEEALAAAEKGPLPESALATLRALHAVNFGPG